MKIAKEQWVHRLLRETGAKSERLAKELALYRFALENAYEGIVVVEPGGTIVAASQAYAAFLHMEISEMVGRPVTEVIPNTRLHLVAQTGKAEIADLQQIHGQWMIASRIPIWHEGELVAVVGKIMFQHIDRLFEMNAKYKEVRSHLHYNEARGRDASGARYSLDDIIGRSKAMTGLKRLAAKVAKSDSTVLISGESGTGKEQFAHAIHRESLRRFGPFVAVNCAAIPESLLESELFGYKEGSFTGARRSGKKGKFALAHRGTIFLDEIGELSLPAQVKLLRVLQEREVEPVGGDRPEAVDVRVLAATNADLKRLVQEGKFRRDLYYRLYVIPLHIPPLRERREDIVPLVAALLQRLTAETGLRADSVEPDCMAALQAYDWPGNVREMRNVLERALYGMEGTRLTLSVLPAEVRQADAGFGQAPSDSKRGFSLHDGGRSSRDCGGPDDAGSAEAHSLELEEGEAEGLTWKASMEALERKLLMQAIARCGGDKQKAARRLGLGKSSFYHKCTKYGLT